MSPTGDDLRVFLDVSPTPFQAVREMARRLAAGGFTELREGERWALRPGSRHYVVRDGGSIVAFRVGTSPLADAGIVGVGAHTDSPTFKVRPRHDLTRHGYRLVGVEPYGGGVAPTWGRPRVGGRRPPPPPRRGGGARGPPAAPPRG